jgi:H+/Cl- antiporter ClcA
MQSIAIVVLCIASAVIYGILHDQVTARICVEYFTIGHEPVFETTSPTWLGIGWGIIATWWVGLMLGILLAIAARAGRRPKRSVRSLVRPIVVLLLIMAACAVLAGVVGYILGRGGIFVLVEPLASRVPEEKHVAFLADGWAHSASYLVGFIGGIVVITRVWRSRRG